MYLTQYRLVLNLIFRTGLNCISIYVISPHYFVPRLVQTKV